MQNQCILISRTPFPPETHMLPCLCVLLQDAVRSIKKAPEWAPGRTPSCPCEDDLFQIYIPLPVSIVRDDLHLYSSPFWRITKCFIHPSRACLRHSCHSDKSHPTSTRNDGKPSAGWPEGNGTDQTFRLRQFPPGLPTCWRPSFSRTEITGVLGNANQTLHNFKKL